MKNWVVLAAIGGLIGWIWLKNKQTQAAPPGGGPLPPSGSGPLPPSAPVTTPPGMTLVKNKFTGETIWILNEALAAFLARDWVLASGSTGPLPPSGSGPLPPSGSGPLPPSGPVYVYDKLYFKQNPGHVKGTGQVVRITASQVQEAISKGYVDAYTVTNAYGNKIITEPLSFYNIWPVGEALS